MRQYQTKSAVLFLIFNRPDTTEKVFEQIRKARPARLYIAADGPRNGNPNDELLCRQARDIINFIDWDCEVKTRFNNENIGCRDGVPAAISWFFNNEEEGIILEDDCLPANSFFKFCDMLLRKYQDDTRIRHITGCNFQDGKKRGNGSYYFSNRTHVWGWASWRRAWKDYDKDLSEYDDDEVGQLLLNIYDDELVVESWVNIFSNLKAGYINSWAYKLDFINFFNNGLVIIPNQNLVSNIGFGTNATNITFEKSEFDHLPLSEIGEIRDPVFILPDKQADFFIMNRDFNIAEKRSRQNAVGNKVKKWFKSIFKNAAV